jgi:adenylate kinase
MSLHVVMLGPPGAGKGTQAARLAKIWQIPHISTGAMLREAIKKGTPLGLEVKAILDSGALVDDGLMTRIVQERLGQADAANGFLLDGFPRTVPQARTLDEMLGAGRPLVIVEVALTDEEVLRRLAARMVCAECGKNSQDDRRDVVSCHDCGGELVPRTDDKEEVVRNRLAVYHRQTAPLVEYYQARPTFCRIDGNQLVDDVSDAIVRTVSGLRPAGPETRSRRGSAPSG